MIIACFRTLESVCCLSNSNSLHMSIEGSHDLPRIPRALKDRLINLMSLKSDERSQ